MAIITVIRTSLPKVKQTQTVRVPWFFRKKQKNKVLILMINLDARHLHIY